MVIIKNDACMSNANIKCRSLARRNKKNKKRTKRTGGHIDITHDIQTKIIIIILAIENRMKLNKMSNIHNTKNSNNDDNNSKKLIKIILLTTVIIIIMIIVIMKSKQLKSKLH